MRAAGTPAIALAMLVAGAAAAAAQQEAPSPAEPGPEPRLWLISCANQPDPSVLRCEFSQSIVLTQGNRRVATVSFERDVGQPELTAVFTVPVGVHLPAGIAASVDDTEAAQVPFLWCDAEGCRGRSEVDAEWLQAMRSGEVLTLKVERADRSPVTFTFQLRDFAETEALLP